MSTEKFWILIWAVILSLVIIGIATAGYVSNRQDRQFIDAGFTREVMCKQWTYEWVKK